MKTKTGNHELTRNTTNKGEFALVRVVSWLRSSVSADFSKFSFKTAILAGLMSLFVVVAPAQMTKEKLGEQGNALLNAGKQKEALELADAYPEFAGEMEVLYIKSIAHTELREYQQADIYFQKQFDTFRDNADSARSDAEDILGNNPPTKENNDLAALMFGASLISYASADMVNSLRAVAFEKNGMPAAKRKPVNLGDFDEMRRAYRETSIEAGLLQLKLNQLKDALANLNKAVELGPTDAAAYRGRAQVYRKMKKLALARADEIKARKLAGK
jgi:tetratricopeptide (TPR) repeat protein